MTKKLIRQNMMSISDIPLGPSLKPDKKELPKIGDLFHKLWGQSTESPEYDKRLWGEFQRLLQDHGFDV